MAISPAIKRAREPAAASSTSYVEIGFLDGNVRTGRLEHFTPTMLDLPVDFDRFGRASLAAEQVAYIAFHRAAGERLSVAPADGGSMERFRIHVGRRT